MIWIQMGKYWWPAVCQVSYWGWKASSLIGKARRNTGGEHTRVPSYPSPRFYYPLIWLMRCVRSDITVGRHDCPRSVHPLSKLGSGASAGPTWSKAIPRVGSDPYPQDRSKAGCCNTESTYPAVGYLRFGPWKTCSWQFRDQGIHLHSVKGKARQTQTWVGGSVCQSKACLQSQLYHQ